MLGHDGFPEMLQLVRLNLVLDRLEVRDEQLLARGVEGECADEDRNLLLGDGRDASPALDL